MRVSSHLFSLDCVQEALSSLPHLIPTTTLTNPIGDDSDFFQQIADFVMRINAASVQHYR